MVTSTASAYISNRLFFTYERYKADRGQGYYPNHGSSANRGNVVAGPNSSRYSVTRSGVPIKVHFFYSVTPTCASQGLPAVNVTSAPQSGQVFTRPGYDYPEFATTNTHSVCNTRRVSSTDVFYRSAAGYVGSDRFTVEVVFPSGNAHQETFDVSVR